MELFFFFFGLVFVSNWNYNTQQVKNIHTTS